MKTVTLLRFMHLWPPYLGAGVRVVRASSDLTSIEVEMKLRFWNRNYVGTHFGGSLYSMIDPFLMLILLNNLGKNYIVWDKQASIRFKKPGRGTVRAQIRINQERIDEIRMAADQDPKTEPEFTLQIVDEAGDLVAEVQKILHVRRKVENPAPDR
jgi:hypothetical protein